MRVLYVAMKYDYGRPEQGHSFEHWNFYHSLAHMGHQVIYFDFMSLHQQHGRDVMNRQLWEITRQERPDLLFSVLAEDELDKETIRRISQETDTVTLNWFCDDHWRFDNFSRYWAPCFNWVVTTAQSALAKYAAIGYKNVIKSQWGVNHFMYRKLDLPLEYNVTFVGQPHGNRRVVIDALQKDGVDVRVWGHGWGGGRLSQEELIRVFNQSRINLNLSNAYTSGVGKPLSPALAPFRSLAARALERFGPGRQLKAWRRARIQSGVAQASYPDQIKARNFEIPGCGGFQLSGFAENLEDYFKDGEEIVCFSDLDDLVEKIRYYLAHEDERSAIAQAGYGRTQRDHRYEKRFREIFEQMGLETS
jgi:spore maturation protein CgeB